VCHKQKTHKKSNWGAFWSNWPGRPSRKSTACFWQFTTPIRRITNKTPSQKTQMTASFLHIHQDCQWSTMSAPEKLSRTPHRTKPSTQLHRKVRDWFRPVTWTVCLANSCLNDVNPYCDSSGIMGKIVHLSVLKTWPKSNELLWHVLCLPQHAPTNLNNCILQKEKLSIVCHAWCWTALT